MRGGFKRCDSMGLEWCFEAAAGAVGLYYPERVNRPGGMRDEAERAVASVVEAGCPVCKVAFRIEDGWGRCPCCGDLYRAGTNRLEIRPSAQARRCEHWRAVSK